MQDLGKLVIDINEGGAAGIGPAGAPSAGPAPRRGFDAREEFQRLYGSATGKVAAARDLASFLRTPTLANVGNIIGPGANVATMLGRALPLLGPFAIGIAALGSAAFVAMRGLMAVRNVMMSLGERIAAVSPQIAMAKAYQQMLEFRTAMQVNRESGGIVARQMRAEARIDSAIMRLQSKLVNEFGPLVVVLTEKLEVLLDGVISWINRMLESIGGVTGLLQAYGDFLTSLGENPLMYLFPLQKWIMSEMGPMLKKLGFDVEAVRRNTAPTANFETNEAFINDLKLMGVPI